MKSIACTISYGKTEIDYELLMMNRKSLEIAVHPDKSVVVKAPISSTLEVIEQKIKKRSRWIKRQINYFKQFDPRTPERQFVGGESHLYLGKKYRLKIQQSIRNKVTLKNGYFYIECMKNSSLQVEEILERWYRERSKIYFSKIFEDSWKNFDKGVYPKPELKIQKMAKRWGSLSGKLHITLNLDLIRAPKECIEYVIIHELCHLIHPHHGSDFYKTLENKMPNWAKRKHKLEMTLI